MLLVCNKSMGTYCVFVFASRGLDLLDYSACAAHRQKLMLLWLLLVLISLLKSSKRGTIPYSLLPYLVNKCRPYL